MATSPLNKAIQDLRQVLLPNADGWSDGQLLDHFIERRDETAFAVLVRRHGPLVWGVCQRVVGHHQDAEDAFQATFLVLARKAASVRPRARVANWLYGVAHRTALKARSMAARRGMRERQVPIMPEPKPESPDPWQDLEPLIDQEVARLPDKYRVAIVLCDLEGKTGKEAARQLQIPEGTLSSRLRTAREMLARGLAHHHPALSGAALAALLSQRAAPTCVPAELVSATVKAAPLFAAGQTAASLVTAQVAALTEGVLKAMFLNKLKLATTLLLLLALISFSGSLHTRQPPARQQTRPESTAHKAPDPRAEALKMQPGAIQKFGAWADKEEAPRPLPPEILKAWRDAGAEVAWMKHVPPQRTGDDFWDPWQEKGEPGAVPALRFRDGIKGTLAKLPDPGVGFGLDFHCGFGNAVQLKTVTGLKSLQSLNFGANLALKDAHLKELAALKNLRGLYLFHTQVTDAGLKELAGLTNLQALDLYHTPVTDAGLKELAGLRCLRALNLGDTKVTDAGLRALGRLKRLQWLNLRGTKVTAAGIAALQKDQPTCKIVVDLPANRPSQPAGKEPTAPSALEKEKLLPSK
jgi:RNA polymerase sigma factor (sigma-70 family)